MLRSPLTPILRSPLSFPLNRIVSGFFPSRLFASGEQGAWYDPSDRATLFQDSAGTTPVTAVEQPVGLILDKSKGLVLGPELVTNGTFDTDTTGWSASNATLSVSSGACVVTATANFPTIGRSISTVAGKTYKLSVDVIQNGVANIFVNVGTSLGNGSIVSFNAVNTTGTKVVFFTATSSTTWVGVQGSSSWTSGQTYSIDNISVRELPGNHAFQATTTSRPVLSARYNLLTKTEQFDDAVWVKAGSGTGLAPVITPNTATAPDGTQTADLVAFNLGAGNTLSDNSGVMQTVPASQSVAYVGGIYLKAASSTDIGKQVAFRHAARAAYTLITLTSDWVRVPVTETAVSTTTTFELSLRGTVTANNSVNALVWGASLVPANQASLPYQRVNTSTDYDADPAKFPVYLRFDGVDDWLQTNSVDFTSTDKMTVFAGVRKLSDAALGMALELSASTTTNTGVFYLAAPLTAGAANYAFSSKGTSQPAASYTNSAVTAPTTDVLTGIGDISGDQVALRVDGTQVASSTVDQGTGNYGNYPLYIGRRGGTTLPFNGQLYSLIVRGAQTSTTQIAQTERWVAGKTGVTL